MSVNFRFFVYITLVAIGFAGCEKDQTCADAYPEGPNVPEDSLCFGNWEWAYTLRHERLAPSEPFYVTDTIFPGDSEPGFEIIHSVQGIFGKSEICFNLNGNILAGCYESWASTKYPAIEPTYVQAAFLQWQAPANSSLVVEPRFPTEPDNTVLARILGLPMYEVSEQQEDTVFYRNWFVRVD